MKRIKLAVPQVATWRRLNTELAELGDVIRLRDSFGDEYREAHDQLRMAERTIAKTTVALEQTDARLEQLNPPPALLDAASEIEALQERLGAEEKASHDRVRLDTFQQDAEHQIRRILRELGRGTEPEQADALRLRVDEPALIRGLGQRFAQLRGQVDEATRTIARHDDQIQRHEKDLEALPQPRDVERLRKVISQTRKVGDLDTQLADARTRYTRAAKKAKTAIAQLHGWTGSPEDLQTLAVPLGPTIDRFELQFQEIATGGRALSERMIDLDTAVRQLESRLQSLELEQDVPTEIMLISARERRDAGWKLVKAAWLEGAIAEKEQGTFVAEFDPKGSLAAAYEQSVHHADALADRLRREADRVAHKAEALAQLHQHQKARAALEKEQQALDERHAHINGEWRTLVTPLAIGAEAKTPAELRAWLRQRDEVIQLLEKAAEIHEGLEPLEQTFQKKRALVIETLDGLAEPVAMTNTDLGEVLDQAEAVLKHHDDTALRRSKLETKLTTARNERAAAELSRQSAETDLTHWRSRMDRGDGPHRARG